MTDSRLVTSIGGRPIPVVPSVVVAAIVGLVLGTLLGLYGPGAPTSASGSMPTSTGSSAPSATANATATAAASPTRTPASSAPSSPVASSSVAPASPSSAPAASGTVLEVRGDGSFVSAPFTVTTGWQIYWQTEGGEFAVALRGDQDYGTIIEQPGPASGVISPVPTGTLTLEVRSTGPWSITIEQP